MADRSVEAAGYLLCARAARGRDVALAAAQSKCPAPWRTSQDELDPNCLERDGMNGNGGKRKPELLVIRKK